MYMKIRGLGVASGRLQAITVAAFLLGVSSGCAVAEDAIRVGVGVDPSFTSWWVAADRGFFTKRNLKVAITQFSGGPDLADATMAGEQDFGSSGTATWMPRFVRSDLLRILCTMATSPDNFKMAALTSIKSLSDLKGKKVGTVSGSSTDYLWALVTKKLGIPESGLDVTGVTPPELVPALVRGDVQAFFSWEPWPTKAVEIAGKDRVHILASSGDVGYFQSFVVVGNKNFIQANPDATARLLAALRDATNYLNNERAELDQDRGSAQQDDAGDGRVHPRPLPFQVGHRGQHGARRAHGRGLDAWKGAAQGCSDRLEHRRRPQLFRPCEGDEVTPRGCAWPLRTSIIATSITK